MTRKPLILSIIALALALFAGAAWFVSRPNTQVATVPPEVAEALVRPWSPVLGPEDALVTIVEFFDPACEACRAFHPIVKDIMAEHGDAVRVVVRYTPFHGEVSDIAIRVLEAARMQGVFEPVMDALMREQPRWASHGGMRPDLIIQIAGEAGLDLGKAEAQIRAPDVVAVLNRDRADVEAVGVRQTPTFFVNERPLDPFGEAELRALVAEEVRRAGS
ncbi:MAG: DsbA family protein [Pelagibaca sp.]